jgi:hypothetical protein
MNLSGFKTPGCTHFLLPLSVFGSYAYRFDSRWWFT